MKVEIQERRSRGAETVLVFGATGKQGGAVVNALTTAGWNVRAFVRDPASQAAKTLASRGMELVHGDFSDVASMRAAMDQAYGVFSIQPNSGSPGSGITDADEVRYGKMIADLAVETGIRHLVYSSAGIIGQGRTGLGNLDCKIEIEDHVRSLDIVATIVRPATFMELLALPDMWSDDGILSFFMSPERPAQFIAVDDIGRIVGGVFNDPDRNAGRTIEMAGDEVTGLDLQEALSDAVGHPAKYRRFPEEVLEGSPFLARNVGLFDEGRSAGNADIAALNAEFGPLLTVREWLDGTGKALLPPAAKRPFNTF